jgi:hypothetical protein
MYYYLGIEVWREDGKTLITQSKYTKELIRMFNMNDFNIVSTLLEHNVKLCSDDTKEVNGTLHPYLVGSLNYLTRRPDIAYSVSMLSPFMAKPHDNH